MIITNKLRGATVDEIKQSKKKYARPTRGSRNKIKSSRYSFRVFNKIDNNIKIQNPMQEYLNLPWIGDIMKLITKADIDKAFKKLLLGEGEIINSNLPEKDRKNSLSSKAPGVDGEKLIDFHSKYKRDPEDFLAYIKANAQPDYLKRVEIPKTNGKIRKLGLPTSRDKVIQEVLKAKIEGAIDENFSSHSFGYRRNKCTFDAAKELEEYINQGAKYAIVCDLSDFFNKVPHNRLLGLLSSMTKDKDFLLLINRFLKCGVKDKNSISPTNEGVPQGGIISPLLANLYLHQLDVELERRNLRFCRYADDFVILVNSKTAAKRVAENTIKFIEKLGLTVNKKKTKIVKSKEIEFLGFNFKNGIGIPPKKKEDFEKSIASLLKIGSEEAMVNNIEKFKNKVTGTISYYKDIGNREDVTTLTNYFLRVVKDRKKKYIGNSNILNNAKKIWVKATLKYPIWMKEIYEKMS